MSTSTSTQEAAPRGAASAQMRGMTEAGNRPSGLRRERLVIGAGDVAAGAVYGIACGLPAPSAAIQPGETVLAFGDVAGVGVFLAAQAVGPQGHVIGVGMSSSVLAQARSNATRAGAKNIDFRLGEIEALPVATASVDLFTSNCIAGLIQDEAAAFAEIRRVLKPGGRLVLSDMVSRGAVPDEVWGNPRMWNSCLGGTTDEAEYLALLEHAGFEKARVVRAVQYPYLRDEGCDCYNATILAEKAA